MLSISWQPGRAWVEVAAGTPPAPACAKLLMVMKLRVKASLLEPFPAAEIHTVH